MESKRFLFDDSWNISRVYLTGIMTPTSKNYSKGYPRSEDIRWYHHPVPPVLVSSFFDSYQVYVYMKYAYIICIFVYKYIHTYP